MKRVLTIQDISGVGKCSLTEALPIISAAGIECAVLPTTVLSTHTAFEGFTFHDLTEDMPGIADHWAALGLEFSSIYTGYLGSIHQVELVEEIIDRFRKEDTLVVVDPAMADNGKLYPGFDGAYVDAMKALCAKADFVVPNITESCFLTGMEYKTVYDKAYIDAHIEALQAMGCKNIILTGVSYRPGKTGIEIVENGTRSYFEHDLLPNSCHGTGDIYASAFVGALTRGKTAYDAAVIAANYTMECIKTTAQVENHWYGAAFEPVLGKLIEMLN